ncbi:hypothetical protein [Microvirga sp. VF16]|uniref:hypothetical protein n=1 Tax=Microvirga sp. VF16 TaxID=2807101 RepID=UPI00193D827A|nr:hypothetical protein [Microvirga sp. VF16]QRM34795.1 hypothetical protein JO965_41775 [Microvirga sp. VF16]
MSALDEKRRLAADEECSTFDFGYEVKDASGWEWTTPGNHWEKPMFFFGDDRDAPSIRGTFHVTFHEGSDEIAESHANILGEVIQGRSSPQPSTFATASEGPDTKVVKIVYQVVALMPAADAYWAQHSKAEKALSEINEGSWIGCEIVGSVENIPDGQVRDELLALGTDGTFFDNILNPDEDALSASHQE